MASKRVIACLGLVAALILVAPGSALAAGTLDQQVTTSNNAHAVYGTLKPAQVFTAAITGQLDQLDLYLSTGFMPGTPTDDLTVQLWTTTGTAPNGAPGSPISGASATIHPAAVPTGSNTWVHVPITAASVAGTQYAIVLSSPGSDGGTCPDVCWQWLADDNNPYSGGGSFYTLNGSGWVAQARDLDFKTYVTPQVNVQIYLSGVGQGANGSVTSSPSGLNCGATCLAAFDVGSQLTLTAHPANTATFGSWDTGPCAQSTNPVCTFTVPSQDASAGALFYGIEPTQAPTPTPIATAKPTPKPTAHASAGTSEAPATVEPTVEASVNSSPGETVAATLEPGATPGPTTIPAQPTSGDDSSTIPLIVGAILLLALLGGGAYLMSRRRPTGSPPPPES